MTTPSCSVVVCTRDRPALLERCLSAVGALDHPSYEVIVVDNGSGDASTARLARRFGAQYLLEPRVGLSRARNVGARAARGDIVAFTDDDGVPDDDWLRRHADALAEGGLSGTTGRVLSLEPDSPTARAHDAVGADDLGPHPLRVDRRSPRWFELANFGGVGVGGNFALRRGLFAFGWGFREDLGLGNEILGEEHYAFFELIRAGHAISYVPEAIVRHQPPSEMTGVGCRKRRTLRSSGAYLVMLLVEERGYRKWTLAYAVTSIGDRRRAWRAGHVTEPFATRRERLAAGAVGPALYALNRLRASGADHRPPPPGPLRCRLE